MRSPGVLVFTLSLLVGLAPGAARADSDEEQALDELLVILHERGIVDEGEYARLRHKQESWRAEQSLGARIEWSGDLRARFAQFWFDRDPLGIDLGKRSRIRYRFRLRGEVEINEWITAVFRLASGQGEARSANQTLGFRDDFAPDDIFIDQAYLEITTPEGLVPGRGQLRFGKMDVPFRWKHSPDSILWDRDLQVEGVALSWDLPEVGSASPYLRAAYLVADENAVSRDPHVFGAQLGVDAPLAADWSVGARATHYEWRSLDEAFLTRSFVFGGTSDGLTGSPGGGSGASVTELAATLGYDGIEDWPLRVYGHVVRNHDADDEELGFGVGLTVGDKRKFVQLGAGWYRMEANAWPGQFVDSPLLAGRVNQESIAFHVLREVLTNTDLKMSLFFGEPVERGAAFVNSLPASERVLLQTDLMVRF